MLLSLLDPVGYGLRRFVPQQVVFNELKKLRVRYDFHSLELTSPSPEVCLVVRPFRIVCAVDFVSAHLIGNGGDNTIQPVRNESKTFLQNKQRVNPQPLSESQVRALLCFFSSDNSNKSVRIQMGMFPMILKIPHDRNHAQGRVRNSWTVGKKVPYYENRLPKSR